MRVAGRHGRYSYRSRTALTDFAAAAPTPRLHARSSAGGPPPSSPCKPMHYVANNKAPAVHAGPARSVCEVAGYASDINPHLPVRRPLQRRSNARSMKSSARRAGVGLPRYTPGASFTLSPGGPARPGHGLTNLKLLTGMRSPAPSKRSLQPWYIPRTVTAGADGPRCRTTRPHRRHSCVQLAAGMTLTVTRPLPAPRKRAVPDTCNGLGVRHRGRRNWFTQRGCLVYTTPHERLPKSRSSAP